MKRLRMMRAPLKYVQGKGALLQFRKWERDGCLSVRTAVTTAAMKIWKRALKEKMIIADMKSSEVCQVSAR